MDLNKSREFFDPKKVKKPCYVIGCGSIGSNVAELLARQGVEQIILWDMDRVESHNIVNQLYTEEDVGELKVTALKRLLEKINPKLKHSLTLIEKPYTNEILSGYVFMCVDNVDVRRDIVENNFYNKTIDAIFDFRTTLLDGQHYGADWSNKKQKESLKNSLSFTHEEAKENTPVSACGFELSVAPVVKITAIQGIINFMNFINGIPLRHMVLCTPYDFAYLAI